MRQREVWIDVAKGIGIIAVVFGHVLPSHVVFLWHMPLFFVLAGYNFHNADNTWQYIWKTTKRLLLPYFACLFVCMSAGVVFGINALEISLKDALFGGVRLKGAYAVFWFVTVLYCMLLCLHLLSRFRLGWWIVSCLLVVAYLPMLYYVELPWNLQVVPMALVYGYVGWLFKKTIKTHLEQIKWYWIVIGVVLFVAASMVPALSMDMKYNDFGMPVVSFVLSGFCVAVVFVSAKYSEKVPPISRVLAFFGKGSMIIMYSLMLINLVLINIVENKWIRLLLVMLLSTLLVVGVEFVKRIGNHALVRHHTRL